MLDPKRLFWSQSPSRPSSLASALHLQLCDLTLPLRPRPRGADREANADGAKDDEDKEAQKGVVVLDAAWAAGARRFRPIILTSLTTFAGLIPILLEKSLQAQFLIPMATSLGFGVIFATFITLLLVPALYLILSDIKWLARAIGGFIQRQF